MENYKIGMGERMKKQRKLLHLTQEQLAEKLNISVKHYGGVERGLAGLSIENLIELSEILDISLDYLVKGIETPCDTIPEQIKSIYLSYSPENRRYIIDLLELIKNLK